MLKLEGNNVGEGKRSECKHKNHCRRENDYAGNWFMRTQLLKHQNGGNNRVIEQGVRLLGEEGPKRGSATNIQKWNQEDMAQLESWTPRYHNLGVGKQVSGLENKRGGTNWYSARKKKCHKGKSSKNGKGGGRGLSQTEWVTLKKGSKYKVGREVAIPVSPPIWGEKNSAKRQIPNLKAPRPKQDEQKQTLSPRKWGLES